MPQNPLDLLRSFAMRNVPPPTPQETENRDLRATALQDADPNPLKRFGRNALDFLTSPLVDDPLAGDPSKASWGSKAGMLLAAAPGLPHLPNIAPEAYNDVKAGGLRLYSRLTDAFAKAPKQLVPDKIRSIAAQGASAEEVGLRKLEDFLSGRPEMGKIPREEVMQHLAANPLELDVVRKRSQPQHQLETPHADARGLFMHDLDTRYGNDWVQPGAAWDPENGPMPPGRVHITAEEAAELERLNDLAYNEHLEHMDAITPPPEDATGYGFMQSPGPKDNYGETLINLPVRKSGKTPEELALEYYKKYDQVLRPDSPSIADFDQQLMREQTYQSPHWEEPNNVVWARHNDRHADVREQVFEDFYDTQNAKPHTYIEDDGSVQPWKRVHSLNPQGKQEWVFPALDGSGGVSSWGDTYEEALDYARRMHASYGDHNLRGVGPKGRFVEEIQSDWHQAGHKRGYRTPEIEAEYNAAEARREELNQKMAAIHLHGDQELQQAIDKISNSNPYSERVDDSGFANVKGIFDDYEETPQKYQGILNDSDHQALSEYLGLRREENENFRHYVMDNPRESMVPDAPFKDNYHELALKQQLLDAANDPSLEWFGVADSDTAQVAEGHIPYLGATDGRNKGMDRYYNEKHPASLGRLLKPFGGEVKYDNLPSTQKPEQLGWANYPKINASSNWGQKAISTGPLGKDHPPVASALTDDPIKAADVADTIKQQGNKLPGGGMWKTNLTPELKQRIKERGFPAMAALLALQQASRKMTDEQ